VVAGEILASDLSEAKQRIKRDGLKQRVELLRIDVTCMPFANESFTHVLNFSGWEDFTAISGEELIDKVFDEMIRVLKTDGILAVTFIPALAPVDEVSRKDRELQDYMYKSRKKPEFFDEHYFVREFEKHGMKPIGRRVFETPKNRLQPQDARGFIEWICANYRSFYGHDVEMRPYEEIIKQFKVFIDKYGIRERRSKFTLLIGKRSAAGKK
jgi:ubiquinone/menaquinone biosynthesis C-methylase UbiE